MLLAKSIAVTNQFHGENIGSVDSTLSRTLKTFSGKFKSTGFCIFNACLTTIEMTRNESEFYFDICMNYVAPVCSYMK